MVWISRFELLLNQNLYAPPIFVYIVELKSSTIIYFNKIKIVLVIFLMNIIVTYEIGIVMIKYAIRKCTFRNI